MAKGIRSLLDTVMQALPQVGNLGLLFFLLFFIFAALGVELFGRLGMKSIWDLYNFHDNNNNPKNVMKTTRAMAWGSTPTSDHLEWPTSLSFG